MASSRVLRVAGGALACGAVVLVGACGSSSSGSSLVLEHRSFVHCDRFRERLGQRVDAPVAWSYSGANGPTSWGSLDSVYALCQVGTAQSPINIETATAVSSPTLASPTVKYAEVTSEVENNGHSIEGGSIDRQQRHHSGGPVVRAEERALSRAFRSTRSTASRSS